MHLVGFYYMKIFSSYLKPCYSLCFQSGRRYIDSVCDVIEYLTDWIYFSISTLLCPQSGVLRILYCRYNDCAALLKHFVKCTFWNSAIDHMILLNHATILNPFHSPLEGPGLCSHDYPSAAHSEGTARTWQNLTHVQIVFQCTLNWA